MKYLICIILLGYSSLLECLCDDSMRNSVSLEIELVEKCIPNVRDIIKKYNNRFPKGDYQIIIRSFLTDVNGAFHCVGFDGKSKIIKQIMSLDWKSNINFKKNTKYVVFYFGLRFGMDGDVSYICDAESGHVIGCCKGVIFW